MRSALPSPWAVTRRNTNGVYDGMRWRYCCEFTAGDVSSASPFSLPLRLGRIFDPDQV